MDFKRYITTKEIRINEDFSIPENEVVEIDWDGMDGAWWKWNGHTGCPFIETDSIKEIGGLCMNIRCVVCNDEFAGAEGYNYACTKCTPLYNNMQKHFKEKLGGDKYAEN